MSDENAAGANAQQTAQPSFNLIGQYIRDMSFENPGAPGSIMMGGPNPSFNVGINVGVKKQSDDVYAVEITLNAKAERDERSFGRSRIAFGQRAIEPATGGPGNGARSLREDCINRLAQRPGVRFPEEFIFCPIGPRFDVVGHDR